MTDPLKGWPNDHGKKPRTDVEPTTGVFVHRMHRASSPEEGGHHEAGGEAEEVEAGLCSGQPGERSEPGWQGLHSLIGRRF